MKIVCNFYHPQNYLVLEEHYGKEKCKKNSKRMPRKQFENLEELNTVDDLSEDFLKSMWKDLYGSNVRKETISNILESLEQRNGKIKYTDIIKKFVEKKGIPEIVEKLEIWNKKFDNTNLKEILQSKNENENRLGLVCLYILQDTDELIQMITYEWFEIERLLDKNSQEDSKNRNLINECSDNPQYPGLFPILWNEEIMEKSFHMRQTIYLESGKGNSNIREWNKQEKETGKRVGKIRSDNNEKPKTNSPKSDNHSSELVKAIENSRVVDNMGDLLLPYTGPRLEDESIIQIVRCIFYSEIMGRFIEDHDDIRVNEELEDSCKEWLDMLEEYGNNSSPEEVVIGILTLGVELNHFIKGISRCEGIINDPEIKHKCSEMYNKIKMKKKEGKLQTNRRQVQYSKYMKNFILTLYHQKYSNIFFPVPKQWKQTKYRKEVLSREDMGEYSKEFVKKKYEEIDYNTQKVKIWREATYTDIERFWIDCLKEYKVYYKTQPEDEFSKDDYMFFYLMEETFGFSYWKNVSKNLDLYMKMYNLQCDATKEYWKYLKDKLHDIFDMFDSYLRCSIAEETIRSFCTILHFLQLLKCDECILQTWSKNAERILNEGIRYWREWDRKLLEGDDSVDECDVERLFYEEYIFGDYKQYIQKLDKNDVKQDIDEKILKNVKEPESWMLLKAIQEDYWNNEYD